MHKLIFRFGVPYLDKPIKELLICSRTGCLYWFIKFVYLHVSRIKFVFRRNKINFSQIVNTSMATHDL